MRGRRRTPCVGTSFAHHAYGHPMGAVPGSVVEPLKRLPSRQPRNAERGGRSADPLFTKQSLDSLRSLGMVSEAEGRVEPLLYL